MRAFARPTLILVGFLCAVLAVVALVATVVSRQRRDREDQAALDAVLALRQQPPLLRMVVPAYFFPGGREMGAWTGLIAAGNRAPITAVVNVEDGPGAVGRPEFEKVFKQAKTAGITLVGYVSTLHGKRPEAEVKADIVAWFQLYPEIDGIFLDAQASGPDKLNLYLGFRKAIEAAKAGAIVVSNPGNFCDESYFKTGATDVACVFEGPEGFPKIQPPRWASNYPRGRFAVLPYNVGKPEDMKSYLVHAVNHGLGRIFVTEASGTNPWQRLPKYWEEEVEAVRRMNQHQAP